jgi:hypothetical protein
MDCPDCQAPTISFAVPDTYREYLPGDEAGAALCTDCLNLHPVGEPPDETPDFQEISDAFPSDADAALPMAILVGLVGNLALYRSAISDLLSEVEQAGADPLLVLDRLANDGGVSPAADLKRRRHQLEQLL